MKIKKYKEFDYLNLSFNQKFCFIDYTNNEIFFPCILEYVDEHTFRDYINEDLSTYNDYDINNNELLILFKNQRESALIGKQYIIIDDSNIKYLLEYFKDDYVFSYIKEICNNNINKLPEQVVPVKFNKTCVNKCKEYIKERYQNDLSNKKSYKMWLIGIIITLIGIIITFILGVY